MSICFVICVWIVGIVQAQDPCRVNVIFSLEASTYVSSEGDSIVYRQINKVQSAYQTWTISPNSVRATLPKPIGCNQGGNWTLQNDTNSLNNVVSSVKRFLYTCFQQNSLSDYITSLNNQILQSQTVDPANYVFIIFTATTDVNDVQQAINLRTQLFDPKGYGLIVVTVGPQTAANLAQLATYGVYDSEDPSFTQDISSAVCNVRPPACTLPLNVDVLIFFDLNLAAEPFKETIYEFAGLFQQGFLFSNHTSRLGASGIFSTRLTSTLWPCQWTSRAYMDLIQDMQFYRNADLFLDYSINQAMLDYTAGTSYCNYPDKHKFLIFVTAHPTVSDTENSILGIRSMPPEVTRMAITFGSENYNNFLWLNITSNPNYIINLDKSNVTKTVESVWNIICKIATNTTIQVPYLL